MKYEYNTKQREKILELLKNEKVFFSAEEVVEKLKDENISKATVYRTLAKLEKEKVVITEKRNNTKCYRYIDDNCNEHYHLKCENCGKLIHFDKEYFENVNSYLKTNHNFHIDLNSIIYGTCDDCEKGRN